MTNSQAGSDPPSDRRTPRPRLVRSAALAAALARSRPDTAELHELLEANLQALRALHEEHQRMLQTSLQAIDGICTELRSELRAIGSARAPWIRAMSETRALLFIALRELVVGAHEADMASQTPPPARIARADRAGELADLHADLGPDFGADREADPSCDDLADLADLDLPGRGR